MTHAEYVQKNAPGMSLAELIVLAEEWYRRERPLADAETAGPTAKLTAWLAAEAEDEGAEEFRTKPEATVVTTLQVTHIVRGIADPDLARAIAATAEKCLRAGYAEHVLLGGHPDEIRTENVQLFTFDEPRIAAAAATPEGSEA